MRLSILLAVLLSAPQFLGAAPTNTASTVAVSDFLDLTRDPGRPDLSRELQTIVQKHCTGRGMNLIPREAERLTNSADTESTLWIIDGRCQWSAQTNDQLHIALRLQKQGFEPRLQEFSVVPGSTLAKAVAENLEQALTSADYKRIGWALNDDTLEGQRRAELREPLPRSRVYGNSPEAQQLRIAERKKMLEDNRQAAIEGYEAALRRNSDDMESRYMLACALFAGDEPQRQRGRELLEQVARGDHAQYARRASTILGGIDRLREALPREPIYPRSRSFIPVSSPNLAAPQSPTLSEPKLWRVFSDRVVLCADGDRLLIADGTELLAQREGPFNPDHIPLPVKLTSRITAIENSRDNFWLGTERDGLLQLAKSGGFHRHFRQANGLSMEVIRSLCVESDRVWLGFGSGFRGGFASVNLQDGTCTRFIPPPDLFGARAAFSVPPEHAAHSIALAKGGVFVASPFALQFYDPAQDRWHLALNERVARVASSPDNGYVAAASSVGNIWFKKVDGYDWRLIGLGEGWPDNRVEDLVLDGRYLWLIAGLKIYRINIEQLRIDAIQKLGSRRARQILVNDSAIMILTAGIQPGTSDLLYMRKPTDLAQK